MKGQKLLIESLGHDEILNFYKHYIYNWFRSVRISAEKTKKLDPKKLFL